MTELRYDVVDVFTDRAFAGNPLAVVRDGEKVGLTTEQMQAIAAEFNLSETVFFLPPARGGSYEARIFTPVTELPFAGHPSVGVAATAVRWGALPAGEVIQECGVGLLPIVAASDRAVVTGGAPEVVGDFDPAPLLAAVSLGSEDGVGSPVRRTSTGLPWTFLQVRPDAVARADVRPDLLSTAGGDVSIFAWDAATATAHTRVFCPERGIKEDPATGSSALAFGVWLASAGVAPADGEFPYTIKQGAELGRPSRIEGLVTVAGGVATKVTVAGAVVPVASGTIAIPLR